MPGLLHYRAGPTARRHLQREGLTADALSTYAGPASGPKWIVLAGFDRALMGSGLLEGGGRKLLVGASAGAWRMMVLASADPARSQQALLDGYIGQTFPPDFTAQTVSAAYRSMLAAILDEAQRARILGHPALDVAAHVVRVRRPVGWTGRFMRQAQAVSLAWIALLQAVSTTGTDHVLERVLFHTRPDEMNGFSFDGSVVALTPENLVDATMASGTVPFYMQPVQDPDGAPRGVYLDGGLSDYHLRDSYAGATQGQGITLFPHFQERIVPIWFDRYWSRRRPTPAALDNVLQVYPSQDWVASLPGEKIPDREDFFTFKDDPQERIRRWNEAARRSDELGEAFLDDLRRGRIPDLIEPL